jgi:DNA-binding MarR family transcriptional regulator
MTVRPTSSTETSRILEPLGVLLRRLTRLTGGADDGPAMTATQRIALIELHDEGPLRLNALADRMGTSAATASRAVDALVQLGLVDRVPDPHDRRAVQLDLSARGRSLVDERKARAADAFAPAVDALGAAERQQLVRLLERMADALAVSPPDASATTRSPAPRRDSATRRTPVG